MTLDLYHRYMPNQSTPQSSMTFCQFCKIYTVLPSVGGHLQWLIEKENQV